MNHILLFSIILCFTAPFSEAQNEAYPDPPSPRTFHRATTLMGEIIVLGGNDLQTHKPSTKMDRFDPKTRKWTSEDIPIKDPLILLPAVIKEKLYVYNSGESSFYCYDSKDERWEKLKSPSVGRPNASIAALEDKLILIGGYNAENKITQKNSIEVYDQKTKSWTIGPSLPDYEPTDHFHLTAVLNGKIHVVGHFFEGKSHWVFDGKTWAKKAEALVVCGWKSAALEAVDGKLVLIQPDLENKNAGNAVFTYNPNSDQWKPTGKVPQGYPFLLGASASAHGKIYTFGGQPTPTKMFIYDVASKKWQISK